MKQLSRLGVVLIVIAVVIVFVLAMRSLRQSIDGKYSITGSPRTVIKELRELNRLETASFTIEKVIDAGTTGNTFQQVLFGDRLLLVAHGEVIAGFDLSSLNEDAVRVEGKTVRLTLPAPEIFIATLDSEQTRVYDRRQGLLSKGDKDLESKARNEAVEMIRQAACQGNILGEAEKNARGQLTALFKTLGFETIILTIPQGKC